MTQVGCTPTYSVKYYRDGLYKLIKFKNGLCCRLPDDSKVLDDDRGEDGKFSQSISRAKSVIYQVAVCNDWDWFVTLTISPDRFDRYDFKGFYKFFSQWVRDYRKKYGCRIEYVLIPEMHHDGAWHLHGFLRGVPLDHISDFIPGLHPQNLIDSGFKNWGLYSQRFGFCSLSSIRDQMAVAAYVTKYITKDLLNSNKSFGGHLYMCSIGLRRAVRMGFIYGAELALDRFLSNDSQFVSTGWVSDVPWYYFLTWLSPDSVPAVYGFEDIDVLIDETVPNDEYVEFTQLNIAGWTSG